MPSLGKTWFPSRFLHHFGEKIVFCSFLVNFSRIYFAWVTALLFVTAHVHCLRSVYFTPNNNMENNVKYSLSWKKAKKNASENSQGSPNTVNFKSINQLLWYQVLLVNQKTINLQGLKLKKDTYIRLEKCFIHPPQLSFIKKVRIPRRTNSQIHIIGLH